MSNRDAELLPREAAEYASLAYSSTNAETANGSAANVKDDVEAGRNARHPLDQYSIEKQAIRKGLTAKAGLGQGSARGFGFTASRGGGNANELIIAIRGTAKAADIFTNLQASFTAGPGGFVVHDGFYGIYQSMRGQIDTEIRSSRASRVHFIGHSLGGALATLAAMDYGGTDRVACHLYTFGAPRVGGRGMETAIGNAMSGGLQTVRRAFCLADPVPMVPSYPFMQYAQGAIGFQGSARIISKGAHDMRDSYRAYFSRDTWPQPEPDPLRADLNYWLDRAENGGVLGGFTLFALEKALNLILRAGVFGLGGVGVGLGLYFTAMERLAVAIERGVQRMGEMADALMRWVRAALRFAGVRLATAVATSSLTADFLRYVLRMISEPVFRAGRSAITHLV